MSESPRAEAATTRLPAWVVPAAIGAGAFVLLLSPLWMPPLLRHLDFFRLRHVEVVGARYIQAQDVTDRLRVDTMASVWDATEPLRRRVAEHPLVREVEVDRRLPGTLVVRVVEHAPVALVPTPTGFKAYDGRGVPLPIDLTKADVDAPIVPRADAGVLRLLATARTDAPGLYRRVSEVRRDGGAGFVIMIDSIPVRTLPDVTLQRLADLEWIETDLARRGVRAIELDLRYRDQVIARLSTP